MINQLYCKHCGKMLNSQYDNFGRSLCCKCSVIRLGDSFYADGFEWIVVYKSLFASGYRTRLTLYKVQKYGSDIVVLNFFKDHNDRLAIRGVDELSEEEMVMAFEIIQRLNNEMRVIK